MVIKEENYSKFFVTGFYYNSNRRFKRIETNSLQYALSINLWKGSVWGILKSTGQWKLLKRVIN